MGRWNCWNRYIYEGIYDGKEAAIGWGEWDRISWGGQYDVHARKIDVQGERIDFKYGLLIVVSLIMGCLSGTAGYGIAAGLLRGVFG